MFILNPQELTTETNREILHMAVSVRGLGLTASQKSTLEFLAGCDSDIALDVASLISGTLIVTDTSSPDAESLKAWKAGDVQLHTGGNKKVLKDDGTILGCFVKD